MVHDKYHQIGAQILPLQIVVLGLVAGILVFAGIVVVISAPQQWFPPLELLGVVALIVAGASVIASWIVGVAMGRNDDLVGAMRSPPADRAEEENLRRLQGEVLLAKLRSVTIVRCAILEGAAFFNLMICFMTFNAWNILAAAMLAGLMLVQAPTRNRAISWMEQHSHSGSW